jgi:predicted GNAT superfamily acetyltransferase
LQGLPHQLRQKQRETGAQRRLQLHHWGTHHPIQHIETVYSDVTQ